MKKIVRLSCVLSIFALLIVIYGCDYRYEYYVKSELEKKYNEEFIVHSIDFSSHGGDRYDAYVSPKNNLNIVFQVSMSGKKMNTYSSDDYAERYTSYLIKELYKEDLEELFPGAYVHSKVSMVKTYEETDLKDKNIEDMIQIADKNYDNMALLTIYCDSDAISKENYEEEFELFEKKTKELIQENKMFPLSVEICKVDSRTIRKLEEYFKTDVRKDGSFESNVLGVSYYYPTKNIEGELGTPPAISFIFGDDRSEELGGETEYIRRRELLDNE